MTVALVVALGSALGAPARYLLERWVQLRHQRVFPWGTFCVNVSGSFLLGVLAGAAAAHGAPAWLVAGAGTGFLGSYTTFSTFTWEAMRLVEDGALLVAVAAVAASVAAGALAAGLGLLLGGW